MARLPKGNLQPEVAPVLGAGAVGGSSPKGTSNLVSAANPQPLAPPSARSFALSRAGEATPRAAREVWPRESVRIAAEGGQPRLCGAIG